MGAVRLANLDQNLAAMMTAKMEKTVRMAMSLTIPTMDRGVIIIINFMVKSMMNLLMKIIWYIIGHCYFIQCIDWSWSSTCCTHYCLNISFLIADEFMPFLSLSYKGINCFNFVSLYEYILTLI